MNKKHGKIPIMKLLICKAATSFSLISDKPDF